MHSFSTSRTPQLQLMAQQPSTEECWTPPKKKPHIQRQKRNPNKIVGEAKSRLESNPIPARDARRAQQNPETPQKLRQTCL